MRLSGSAVTAARAELEAVKVRQLTEIGPFRPAGMGTLTDASVKVGARSLLFVGWTECSLGQVERFTSL